MPKLHEIVAVVTGKKGEVERAVTDAYHVLQKGDLFDEIVKTYAPAEENGEALPAERKIAQRDLKAVIAETAARWSDLFDITLTMDAGNQLAKGDIVVDGVTLLAGVPVPTLLFLQKQLENVKAFVDKLPTPDPAEVWRIDPNQSKLAAEPTRTFRTKKVQKPIVIVPATEQDPAQVTVLTEDVVAGYWTTAKYTTRMAAAEKATIAARAEALLDAVKVAREQANAQEVTRRAMGPALLGYVFGTKVGTAKPTRAE